MKIGAERNKEKYTNKKYKKMFYCLFFCVWLYFRVAYGMPEY